MTGKLGPLTLNPLPVATAWLTMSRPRVPKACYLSRVVAPLDRHILLQLNRLLSRQRHQKYIYSRELVVSHWDTSFLP